MGLQADGAAAGAAAAVGGAEGLVEVQVHAVEAVVAGSGGADHGVHVGAVAEDLAARVVDHAADLLNGGLEEAEGGGVREHQRRHAGAVFLQGLRQRAEVGVAFGVRGDRDDVVAAARRRGGVGAVGGVGDEDDGAFGLAERLVVGLDEHEARHLAVGARDGLEGDLVEAGDRAEHLLDPRQNLQRAGDRLDRLHGVELGEAGHAGGLLVDLRVVLHRARAQRVEAGLDAVIDVAEVREVAQEIQLAHLGEVERGARLEVGLDLGRVAHGDVAADPSRAGLLEDQTGLGNALGGHREP